VKREVLPRCGYVEKMGLEWIAADEEAVGTKLLTFAGVGDVA
jgi:hypothetical protein